MAVNLTPKADATLVAQSYRMGMAGVPQDLSRTFDGISKSYSSAMGEVGRAGAIVGEQVGQLAGEGLKIAIQNIKDNNTGLDDLSDAYSLDARQGIVDELQKLKKGNNLFIDDDGDPETNKVLNPRYIPFSKKGKEAREEFRRKKNIAIKDLKAMQDGTFMNATAIEQNAIVQDGSSQQEWVMNNAIASKGYPLKEGDYAGVSAKSFYKDVDGEQRQHFMLVKDGKEVMIDDNGAIVDVAEGKEGIHTAATDIGSLIKKKDANVAPNLIKIQETVYNNSLKGLDFQANITKSAITNSIKTNDQAITAFHSNELGLDISYAQALEGENEITSEMFVGLLDVNKDGKVDASETSFAGLKGDFSTAENMIKLKKAMLDPNNSKSRDIFANWATSELTKVHDSGNKVYVRNQPKGELEGPTLAKLIDDKKFPIKLNTNTYIIANKEGKVATVKANEISMDEDYFAKQNIVFKDPSAFGATPLSIDLPDMPDEKEKQIKLIMNSNKNLNRKQAEDLYNYQLELNR